MPILGFWDLLIILFVALLIFGPKRLPLMGRSIGSSLRGFKDAITERHDRLDQQELPPAPAETPEPRERDTVL